MPSICLYFQVHQPHRLKKYTIFDAEHDFQYFDEKKNKEILLKVAEKCYLPANKLMLELIRKHQCKFRVAYSISGTAIEQFIKYCPEVMASFRALALTGCVEFISETYYHSLASVFSKNEFVAQVQKHKELMQDSFDYTPTVFRNTELIYSNELGKTIEELGYTGVLTEGVDHILGWRSPNFVYKASGTNDLKVLLRNYKLSDDIAYRFSNRAWTEYPLTAAKFTNWLNEVNTNGNVVNLFMDYETFGEHHWKESGIFEFLAHLPKEVLKNANNQFVLPSEACQKIAPQGEVDVPNSVSWADSEKDLSAWLGNNMQKDAANALYKLDAGMKGTKNKNLLEDWRKLTSADHLYYISTKHLGDGAVHTYFSPYKSPYDAFINYMNVLENMRKRLTLGPVNKIIVKAKNVLKKVVAKKKTIVQKKVVIKKQVVVKKQIVKKVVKKKTVQKKVVAKPKLATKPVAKAKRTPLKKKGR